ncbi:MAG: thioredoxin domain-containing protein [Bacteroidales bacterium]
MKKLKSLVLFLFLSVVVFAQQPIGTIFEHGTLAEALAKASKNKKGPKLVFLDCFTTWCGPCKNMSEKIFPMEKVGAFFNSNFVNIKIDMEKGEGPELAKRFNVKAYPTFLILSLDGKEISRVVGGGDADGFITRVKKAMNPDNTPQARLATYNADKNFNNAFAYLEVLQDSYMTAEQNEFLDKNFDSFKWYEKYSHEMLPFISTSLKSYKSGLFECVTKDMTKASEAFGKDKVNTLLAQNIKQYIIAYFSNKIEGATIVDLQKRLDILAFVNNNDKLSNMLAEIANCAVCGDYSNISNIFQPYYLSVLSQNDRNTVERIVIAIKDKVDPKIIYSYYRSMAASTKKSAENYAKLAETYKPEK